MLDYLVRAGLDLKVENEIRDCGRASRRSAGALQPGHCCNGRSRLSRESEVASLIDEIPVLAVLGSQAAGGLKISDAHELRVKESDRISAIVTNLRAMGIEVEEKADGLSMPGGQQLQGADIITRNDHRIAMAFAVAALAAQGETRIHNAECADVSFPRLLDRVAEGHRRVIRVPRHRNQGRADFLMPSITGTGLCVLPDGLLIVRTSLSGS